ncbi:MAG: WecB/TagA/CpsF family glycosyltransferase [Deltaproteobacteria bacterium]|nr:WecB/TagA/CpsF family glycosyltransferase [Deltaproteobacteria bacterium]
MKREPVIILGVPIDRLTMDQTVEQIFHLVECYARDSRPRLVCTVNADFLANTLGWNLRESSHPELQRILRRADVATADGMPLVWASRLLGPALSERVTGADLVPRIASEAAGKGRSIYLLGGNPGAAEKAAGILEQANPGLKIAGWDSPFVHTRGTKLPESYEDDSGIVGRINESRADILLIAFGNPKQEIWFERNRDRLKVPVSIGVGGTFDFITGSTHRAPLWMQNAGMEWLWRLSRDPARLWKRYLIDLLKIGALLWPSVLFYQHARATAPHGYLRKCKNGIVSRHGSTESGEFHHIVLPGVLDAGSAERIRALVPRKPTAHLILDFSEVGFTDSAGLGFLLNIILLMDASAFGVFFAGLSEDMKKNLKYNRLYDLVSCREYRDVDHALHALDEMIETPPPQYELEKNGQRIILRLSGELCVSRVPHDLIRILVSDEGKTECEVDLSRLRFIDSAGIVFLFHLKQALEEKGKPCFLKGAAGDVAQMLKVAGARALL